MISLHLNIDHIATLRQARGGIEPDPLTGALMAELAGANGITAHLREDRRHIQDRDLFRFCENLKTFLNLEMAATDEMTQIAAILRPKMVTLVPEKREELTTEGGLNLKHQVGQLQKTIDHLKTTGIEVSLFVDSDPWTIDESARLGCDAVELHTGLYAGATSSSVHQSELQRLKSAAEQAHQLQLKVNAGHGLNYRNVLPIAHLPHLQELNIGYSIISHSLFVGLPQAVREMRTLLDSASYLGTQN